MTANEERVPVILDTDIGSDIDDTWALAFLLRSPKLELQTVLVSTGDLEYRARVAAGVLSAAGRPDVPIGMGSSTGLAEESEVPPGRPQAKLAEQADLKSYRGGVREDGVDALVERIMSSDRKVTIIGIGPMTSIASAIRLEPRIVERARIVAMLGSVRVGYNSSAEPAPEGNVAADVSACRAVFAAAWEVTIAPLDVCGSIVVEGRLYARLRKAQDPLIRTVIGSYEAWDAAITVDPSGMEDWFFTPGMSSVRSTVLFDTLPIYLADDEAMVDIETLPLSVTDDGRMTVHAAGPMVRVATRWRRPNFPAHLTERLLSRD